MLKLPHTMTSFVPWTALLLATACAGHSTPPPAATSALRDAPAPEEVLEQVVAERQAETAPVVFVRDSVDGVDALLDHWRRIDSARASDADVQAHYEAMADVLATHRRLRVTP